MSGDRTITPSKPDFSKRLESGGAISVLRSAMPCPAGSTICSAVRRPTKRSESRPSSDLTISDAWKTYRQALRDLPASANPTLNTDGTLNQSSVTWPTEPS